MSRPKRNEQGFILISAVWLLVLCGAIAAVLMLRSISAARASASEGEALQRTALQEGAIETAFASILFTGGRSHSAAVPSSGPVTIGGRAVQVTMTSENGRIDLNHFPLPKLALVLQGLGVAAEDRQRILGALQARREADRPLTSGDEVRALLAGAQPAGDAQCLEDEFTIFSALPSPRESQVSERLAKAIGLARAGQTGAGANPEPIGAGTPLRVQASTGSGPPLIAVARITGLNDGPVAVSHWEQGRTCAG